MEEKINWNYVDGDFPHARYYPYSMWVARKWYWCFIFEFHVYHKGEIIGRGYAINKKIAMRMAEKVREKHKGEQPI